MLLEPLSGLAGGPSGPRIFGLAGGWRLEDLAWLQQGRIGTNRGAIRVVPFGPGQGDVYVSGERPQP